MVFVAISSNQGINIKEISRKSGISGEETKDADLERNCQYRASGGSESHGYGRQWVE